MKGLVSENQKYNTKYLDTNFASHFDDDAIKQHYPSFVIPRKIVDFKWILGTKFSTKFQSKNW